MAAAGSAVRNTPVSTVKEKASDRAPCRQHTAVCVDGVCMCCDAHTLHRCTHAAVQDHSWQHCHMATHGPVWGGGGDTLHRAHRLQHALYVLSSSAEHLLAACLLSYVLQAGAEAPYLPCCWWPRCSSHSQHCCWNDGHPYSSSCQLLNDAAAPGCCVLCCRSTPLEQLVVRHPGRCCTHNSLSVTMVAVSAEAAVVEPCPAGYGPTYACAKSPAGTGQPDCVSTP